MRIYDVILRVKRISLPFAIQTLIIIFVITTFQLLAACNETKSVELNTTYHKKLVCTGFAGNDGKVMVYLQINHPPLKSGADTTAIEANMIVLHNNTEKEGLNATGFNFYEIPQPKPFSAGDNLSLWIDTPHSGTTYSSSVVMPITIAIDSVKLTPLTKGLSQVQIYFNDPPERNYYGIKKIWITEAGIVPDNYLLVWPGEVFDDKKAKNNQMLVTERIYHSHRIDGENYPLQQVMIILYHLSEPAFRFFSSIWHTEGELEDIFEEPTIIYSNIHNGLGVFATYASDTLIVNVNP